LSHIVAETRAGHDLDVDHEPLDRHTEEDEDDDDDEADS
jgi:hypothetical protein